MKANRQASREIRRRLAGNLKRLRRARGHTQKGGLTKLCAPSKTYVGNVEQATENITLASLETLASGLGCSEVDLLLSLPRRTGQS